MHVVQEASTALPSRLLRASSALRVTVSMPKAWRAGRAVQLAVGAYETVHVEGLVQVTGGGTRADRRDALGPLRRLGAKVAPHTRERPNHFSAQHLNMPFPRSHCLGRAQRQRGWSRCTLVLC